MTISGDNNLLTCEEKKLVPPCLRVFLVNDGLVTAALSAYFMEEMKVETVYQEEISTDNRKSGMLKRRAVILGASTGTHYILADSLINLSLFESAVIDDILSGKKGIGTIIREHRIETYREIDEISLCVRSEPLLSADSPERLLSRKYRIIKDGLPAIRIEEFYREKNYK